MLAIVCGTSYYVYHAHKKASNPNSSAQTESKVTVSPAKTQPSSPSPGSGPLSLDSQQVSFDGPSGWSGAKPAHVCLLSKPLHCLDSLEVLPPFAQGLSNGAEYGISVAVYSTPAQESANTWFFDNWCDCSSAQTDYPNYMVIQSPINGYDAAVITYSHANDSGNDVYYVLKKASLTALVSYSNYPDQTAGDAADYISQVKTMVLSLRLQ